MSRKKIVAGNWKMNLSFNEATSLAKAVADDAADDGIIKILFPPFVFIHELARIAHGKKNLFVGAQNCHHLESGAYTGEVSARAISSAGAKYVIIGHSERRVYFHETSEELRQKMDVALKNGLTPVFCVGEKLNERKGNHYFHAVKKQVEEVVFHLPEAQAKKIILAYEPVWAIGTGETASPEQAQEMHAFIRLAVAEKFGKQLASGISILYGGSCHAGNAKELFACKDVDGGLVGGASLKAEEFVSIIRSF